MWLKDYLLIRYGSRGDAYFSLVKTRGSALGDSVAFLKFDRSMKEWTEVHFHCLERVDMEKVCMKSERLCNRSNTNIENLYSCATR